MTASVSCTRRLSGSASSLLLTLALGVAVMTLAARVSLPMPGSITPMTLQLLGLLLIAFMTTPRRAALVMLSYLACGAAGLPVFSPLAMGLLGPTGGYLMGFVPAAWLASAIGGDRSWVGKILGGLAATVVVLGLGTLWLSAWNGLGIPAAVAVGLLPFVGKALVEVALAVGLASRWSRAGRSQVGNGAGLNG